MRLGHAKFSKFSGEGPPNPLLVGGIPHPPLKTHIIGGAWPNFAQGAECTKAGPACCYNNMFWTIMTGDILVACWWVKHVGINLTATCYQYVNNILATWSFLPGWIQLSCSTFFVCIIFKKIFTQEADEYGAIFNKKKKSNEDGIILRPYTWQPC